MRSFLVALIGLAVCSGTATAQTVSNPSAVAFVASADHDVIWTPAPGEPGTAGPVLTNYVLEVRENGTAVRSTDLGKPTPSATRQIVASLTMTGLQQAHTYTAVVVAVGPGGNTPSAPTASFGWVVSTPLAPAGVTNVILLAEKVPSSGITVGGRVMAGSAGVLVRPSPSLSSPSDIVQPPGALGTAIGGPTVADGYTWWDVDWDTGTDGWGTEGPSFLTVAP